MKTLLLISVILLTSCSSDNDPQPQKPCAQLEQEINVANKAIADHHAKGSEGNPEAWRSELSRLTRERDVRQAEYTKRACL